MNAQKIAGVVLVVAGIAGLVYGRFGYTTETHEAKLGTMEFSVKEKKSVEVPAWAGAGMILIGGVLFWSGGRKRQGQ
jgi:hypothetical protein